MKVNFINVPDQYHLVVKKAITNFIRIHQINPNANLNLTFISRSKIKTLNQKYRKIHEPTDVLSFPIWSSLAEIPKNGEVSLGDIFICPEMTNIKTDLIQLVEHSLKHLIGIHH